MTSTSVGLATLLLAGFFSSCAGWATPSPAPWLASTQNRSQSVPACAAFDSRLWAQIIFDDDPALHTALDPDRDGLACEELPLGAAPALWTDVVPSNAIPVELASVTDGDTVEVVLNGRLEAVRLVGVDAPESGGPYQDIECFGLEGADFLSWLLGFEGQLFIEQDQEHQDRFGRLLRWVWLDLGDGEIYLVNEAVIRAGYAERFHNTPNRRYVDELIEAEDFAERYSLGLWGACEAGFNVEASPTIPPSANAATSCDPAYPDVCIPSPPPDLECRDIPYARFRVFPPDPHNFDGNRDGVACEGPG
ncbi:MAG: thermonuclease family protein [Thermomicrobiales bacterium]